MERNTPTFSVFHSKPTDGHSFHRQQITTNDGTKKLKDAHKRVRELLRLLKRTADIHKCNSSGDHLVAIADAARANERYIQVAATHGLKQKVSNV